MKQNQNLEPSKFSLVKKTKPSRDKSSFLHSKDIPTLLCFVISGAAEFPKGHSLLASQVHLEMQKKKVQISQLSLYLKQTSLFKAKDLKSTTKP